MRWLSFRLFAALAAVLIFCSLPAAATGPEIFPLNQIKPGMKGVGYTIFSGGKIQPFDVEVIGVLPNLIGPKQDVVLVRLSSPEIAKSGVVAGMSGSPVYIDGKLAGAVAYKFGTFTAEAIAGMTPIEDELAVSGSGAAPPGAASDSTQYALPDRMAQQAGVGGGAYLEPIAAPLVVSGFMPSVVGHFTGQLEKLGMMATEGGSVPASTSSDKGTNLTRRSETNERFLR